MALTRDGSGNLAQAELFKRNGGQNVTIGATSQGSAAINDGVRTVRLAPDANCFYARAASSGSVTTSNGSYLAAGAIEYVGVMPGEKIFVIQATGSDSGSLNITEEQP